MSSIYKKAYVDMFGPTTGDRVRLADTDLIIEVEKDFTTYGNEVKFGGGKVIRDGQGQSQLSCKETVDTVITNALIVDYSGIYKADIGIKEGYISAIGKAGNLDIQDNVTFSIGAGTEVISGEGLIVTAGGIDSHIHFICPQQCEEALSSGVTTLIGGGTGPATGTNATTCTPGIWNMEKMLEAAEALPVNIGFMGKGNCSLPTALVEQLEGETVLADRKFPERVRIHDAELRPGQRRADRAGLVSLLHRLIIVEEGVHGVHRGDGRRFRGAETLVDFLLELGAVKVAEFVADFFRARPHGAKMREHQRMDVAARAVDAEERPRAHHHRHLEFRAEAAYRLRVRRIRVRDHGDALHEAHHRRDGESERMEEREYSEHHVFARRVENAHALLDVADQVEMREFHALRRSFGT